MGAENFHPAHEFWDPWRTHAATPLYYRPFLTHFPDRVAAVVTAIATAPPGGVLVHCASGRDRTGLIALLLLALAGATAEDIAADYELSRSRLHPLYAHLGQPDQGPVIDELLERDGTSIDGAITDLLDGFDAAAYLHQAGVSGATLTALRDRLATLNG